MGIEQCRIIELPKIADPRGNLSFIEGGRHIPLRSSASIISMTSREAKPEPDTR